MNIEAFTIEHHLSMYATVVIGECCGNDTQRCICGGVWRGTHAVRGDKWLDKNTRIRKSAPCRLIGLYNFFLRQQCDNGLLERCHALSQVDLFALLPQTFQGRVCLFL